MKGALHKIFIIETIINFFTNGILNALCAWLINMRSNVVDVGIWSVMIDVFITAHCTCLLTIGFAHFSAKRYMKLGLYTECDKLSGFAKNPVLLGFLMGDLSFIAGFLIVISLFNIAGITALPIYGFVLYKGIFGSITGVTATNIALRRFMLKTNDKNAL